METSKQESNDLLTSMSDDQWKKANGRIELPGLNPYRDQVIEEVAQAIEKFTAFGNDTISSFAMYIRSMKK